MKNIKEKTKVFLFAIAVMGTLSPVLVHSDAGPPDVITVKSLKEAETLMPVSGVIESISLEQGEVVISDSYYQIAPTIKFYSGKKRPVSSDRFTTGAWVGAYLDDMSQIKSLHIIEQPDVVNQNKRPKPPHNENQKKGGFYFENGVYKN